MHGITGAGKSVTTRLLTQHLAYAAIRRCDTRRGAAAPDTRGSSDGGGKKRRVKRVSDDVLGVLDDSSTDSEGSDSGDSNKDDSEDDDGEEGDVPAAAAEVVGILQAAFLVWEAFSSAACTLTPPQAVAPLDTGTGTGASAPTTAVYVPAMMASSLAARVVTLKFDAWRGTLDEQPTDAAAAAAASGALPLLRELYFAPYCIDELPIVTLPGGSPRAPVDVALPATVVSAALAYGCWAFPELARRTALGAAYWNLAEQRAVAEFATGGVLSPHAAAASFLSPAAGTGTTARAGSSPAGGTGSADMPAPAVDDTALADATARLEHWGDELARLVDAFKVLDVSAPEAFAILELVAALQHLSNISFVDRDDASSSSGGGVGGGPCRVAGEGGVAASPPTACAAALGVNEAQLRRLLTSKLVEVQGERIHVPLPAGAASRNRWQLVNWLGGRLLEWVTARLNLALSQAMQTALWFTRQGQAAMATPPGAPEAAALRVLDGYGFSLRGGGGAAAAAAGSYRNLAHNVVAEHLYAVFAASMFLDDYAALAGEGLDAAATPFRDNAPLLEALGARTVGILSLLDTVGAEVASGGGASSGGGGGSASPSLRKRAGTGSLGGEEEDPFADSGPVGPAATLSPPLPIPPAAGNTGGSSSAGVVGVAEAGRLADAIRSKQGRCASVTLAAVGEPATDYMFAVVHTATTAQYSCTALLADQARAALPTAALTGLEAHTTSTLLRRLLAAPDGAAAAAVGAGLATTPSSLTPTNVSAARRALPSARSAYGSWGTAVGVGVAATAAVSRPLPPSAEEGEGDGDGDGDSDGENGSGGAPVPTPPPVRQAAVVALRRPTGVPALATTAAASTATTAARFLSPIHRFRNEVSQFLSRLERADLMHVVCLRPNTSNVPKAWDGRLVAAQLGQLSVVDSLTAQARAYPIQFSHADFYRRYWFLVPGVAVPVTGRSWASLLASDATLAALAAGATSAPALAAAAAAAAAAVAAAPPPVPVPIAPFHMAAMAAAAGGDAGARAVWRQAASDLVANLGMLPEGMALEARGVAVGATRVFCRLPECMLLESLRAAVRLATVRRLQIAFRHRMWCHHVHAAAETSTGLRRILLENLSTADTARLQMVVLGARSLRIRPQLMDAIEAKLAVLSRQAALLAAIAAFNAAARDPLQPGAYAEMVALCDSAYELGVSAADPVIALNRLRASVADRMDALAALQDGEARHDVAMLARGMEVVAGLQHTYPGFAAPQLAAARALHARLVTETAAVQRVVTALQQRRALAWWAAGGAAEADAPTVAVLPPLHTAPPSVIAAATQPLLTALHAGTANAATCTIAWPPPALDAIALHALSPLAAVGGGTSTTSPTAVGCGDVASSAAGGGAGSPRAAAGLADPPTTRRARRPSLYEQKVAALPLAGEDSGMGGGIVARRVSLADAGGGGGAGTGVVAARAPMLSSTRGRRGSSASVSGGGGGGGGLTGTATTGGLPSARQALTALSVDGGWGAICLPPVVAAWAALPPTPHVPASDVARDVTDAWLAQVSGEAAASPPLPAAAEAAAAALARPAVTLMPPGDGDDDELAAAVAALKGTDPLSPLSACVLRTGSLMVTLRAELAAALAGSEDGGMDGGGPWDSIGRILGSLDASPGSGGLAPSADAAATSGDNGAGGGPAEAGALHRRSRRRSSISSVILASNDSPPLVGGDAGVADGVKSSVWAAFDAAFQARGAASAPPNTAGLSGMAATAFLPLVVLSAPPVAVAASPPSGGGGGSGKRGAPPRGGGDGSQAPLPGRRVVVALPPVHPAALPELWSVRLAWQDRCARALLQRALTGHGSDGPDVDDVRGTYRQPQLGALRLLVALEAAMGTALLSDDEREALVARVRATEDHTVPASPHSSSAAAAARSPAPLGLPALLAARRDGLPIHPAVAATLSAATTRVVVGVRLVASMRLAAATEALDSHLALAQPAVADSLGAQLGGGGGGATRRPASWHAPAASNGDGAVGHHHTHGSRSRFSNRWSMRSPPAAAAMRGAADLPSPHSSDDGGGAAAIGIDPSAEVEWEELEASVSVASRLAAAAADTSDDVTDGDAVWAAVRREVAVWHRVVQQRATATAALACLLHCRATLCWSSLGPLPWIAVDDDDDHGDDDFGKGDDGDGGGGGDDDDGGSGSLVAAVTRALRDVARRRRAVEAAMAWAADAAGGGGSTALLAQAVVLCLHIRHVMTVLALREMAEVRAVWPPSAAPSFATLAAVTSDPTPVTPLTPLTPHSRRVSATVPAAPATDPTARFFAATEVALRTLLASSRGGGSDGGGSARGAPMEATVADAGAWLAVARCVQQLIARLTVLGSRAVTESWPARVDVVAAAGSATGGRGATFNFTGFRVADMTERVWVSMLVQPSRLVAVLRHDALVMARAVASKAGTALLAPVLFDRTALQAPVSIPPAAGGATDSDYSRATERVAGAVRAVAAVASDLARTQAVVLSACVDRAALAAGAALCEGTVCGPAGRCTLAACAAPTSPRPRLPSPSSLRLVVDVAPPPPPPPAWAALDTRTQLLAVLAAGVVSARGATARGAMVAALGPSAALLATVAAAHTSLCAVQAGGGGDDTDTPTADGGTALSAVAWLAGAAGELAPSVSRAAGGGGAAPPWSQFTASCLAIIGSAPGGASPAIITALRILLHILPPPAPAPVPVGDDAESGAAASALLPPAPDGTPADASDLAHAVPYVDADLVPGSQAASSDDDAGSESGDDLLGEPAYARTLLHWLHHVRGAIATAILPLVGYSITAALAHHVSHGGGAIDAGGKVFVTSRVAVAPLRDAVALAGWYVREAEAAWPHHPAASSPAYAARGAAPVLVPALGVSMTALGAAVLRNLRAALPGASRLLTLRRAVVDGSWEVVREVIVHTPAAAPPPVPVLADETATPGTPRTPPRDGREAGPSLPSTPLSLALRTALPTSTTSPGGLATLLATEAARLAPTDGTSAQVMVAGAPRADGRADALEGVVLALDAFPAGARDEVVAAARGLESLAAQPMVASALRSPGIGAAVASVLGTAPRPLLPASILASVARCVTSTDLAAALAAGNRVTLRDDDLLAGLLSMKLAIALRDGVSGRDWGRVRALLEVLRAFRTDATLPPLRPEVAAEAAAAAALLAVADALTRLGALFAVSVISSATAVGAATSAGSPVGVSPSARRAAPTWIALGASWRSWSGSAPDHAAAAVTTELATTLAAVGTALTSLRDAAADTAHPEPLGSPPWLPPLAAVVDARRAWQAGNAAAFNAAATAFAASTAACLPCLGAPHPHTPPPPEAVLVGVLAALGRELEAGAGVVSAVAAFDTLLAQLAAVGPDGGAGAVVTWRWPGEPPPGLRTAPVPSLAALASSLRVAVAAAPAPAPGATADDPVARLHGLRVALLPVAAAVARLRAAWAGGDVSPALVAAADGVDLALSQGRRGLLPCLLPLCVGALERVGAEAGGARRWHRCHALASSAVVPLAVIARAMHGAPPGAPPPSPLTGVLPVGSAPVVDAAWTIARSEGEARAYNAALEGAAGSLERVRAALVHAGAEWDAAALRAAVADAEAWQMRLPELATWRALAAAPPGEFRRAQFGAALRSGSRDAIITAAIGVKAATGVLALPMGAPVGGGGGSGSDDDVRGYEVPVTHPHHAVAACLPPRTAAVARFVWSPAARTDALTDLPHVGSDGGGLPVRDMSLGLLGVGGELAYTYPQMLVARLAAGAAAGGDATVCELYLQLLRQLAGNPSRDSRHRLWSAVAALLRTTPPPPAVENVVEVAIYGAAGWHPYATMAPRWRHLLAAAYEGILVRNGALPAAPCGGASIAAAADTAGHAMAAWAALP